jgi:ABC-type branched-subunit amino acid transport system substrate-binding protein
MRNRNDRAAVRVARRRTGLLRAGATIAALGGALTLGAASPSGASTPTPVTKASTSSLGVTATTINVVFPLVSFSSIEGEFEIASDAEYGEQVKAIHLFVNQINGAGGINGRKIHPIIQYFDPTNEAEQRSLCKQWTQGSPPVFAVLDGLGGWAEDNQLCITQEGHTPLLSQWTTTTNWTTLGSPYLWWTGADDAQILAATVSWGRSSGRLGAGKKVGVVVSDQESDQDALNSYLLPDLKKIGITPQIETVSADLGETASTDSDATLAVERLKAAGVNSVIPLLPENAFDPYITAETAQKYFPTLLLSDYETELEVGLGLIGKTYDKALNGQEGVTAETLGGIDDPRPESEGGYDPGVRSCWTTWHKAYPQIPKGNENDDIEEQGPVQGWCQEIRLFAQAATMAGKDLNRRTFVEAMARIKNFQGGYSPVLTYGPDKFAGPTEYRVVSLHDNDPPSSQCKIPAGKLPPQGRCWVVVQPWKPLPPAA